MFIELFEMLRLSEHYNQSEEIEILKGLYYKPNGLKNKIKKLKRIYKWQPTNK